MDEYIKREAAIEAVKHAWAKGLEPSQYIEIIPAVDAVPVVRCRDCKHCNISLVLPTGRKMYNCMEGSHDHQTLLKSNDFCSRGETRKDREYIDSEKKGGEEE